MAGAGFKDFAVGEVLTATDVDTYLMQQSVMRFADSAARGSALGTATGTAVPLAEGMVSYLDDLNVVEVFTGSGWRAPGAGIGSNVVSVTKTNTFSTSSTSYTTVTGMSATITPTSAASKVLIIVQLSVGLSSGAGWGHFRLSGGNSAAYIGTTVGSRIADIFGGVSVADTASSMVSQSIVYLDSPASASPITYEVEARQAGSGAVYVNRSANDGDDAGRGRGASSITLIEVAA